MEPSEGAGARAAVAAIVAAAIVAAAAWLADPDGTRRSRMRGAGEGSIGTYCETSRALPGARGGGSCGLGGARGAATCEGASGSSSVDASASGTINMRAAALRFAARPQKMSSGKSIGLAARKKKWHGHEQKARTRRCGKRALAARNGATPRSGPISGRCSGSPMKWREVISFTRTPRTGVRAAIAARQLSPTEQHAVSSAHKRLAPPRRTVNACRTQCMSWIQAGAAGCSSAGASVHVHVHGWGSRSRSHSRSGRRWLGA